MTKKPIWAPWRIDYILGEKHDGCVFCSMPDEDDDKRNNILKRGETCYVVLNLFPYVAPFRHIADYDALTPEELQESARLTRESVIALKKAFKPDGFNIGVNQGTAGGAGIEEHLHIHIVPRWNGDFNFMPVIGQTKVIPVHLSDTYDTLKDVFK